MIPYCQLANGEFLKNGEKDTPFFQKSQKSLKKAIKKQ